MKKLIFLILFFTISCASKNEEKETHIQLSGLSDFGKVILGDQTESLYILKNENSSNPTPVTLNLSPPFFIVGASPSSCQPSMVPAGINCLYKIRFNPDEKGQYSFSLGFRGETLRLYGEGILPGKLSLSPMAVDLKAMVAGEQKSVEFVISNQGEALLSLPELSLPSDLSFHSSTCDTFIRPSASCLIVLKVSPTIRTNTYFKKAIFSSGQDKKEAIFSGEIKSDASSGNISFVQDPLKQVLYLNENQPIQIYTQPIKDRFGNLVEDGTAVTVNVSNLVLDQMVINNQPVLSKTYFTLNGIIYFEVKASYQDQGTLAAGFSAQTSTSFGSYQFSVTSGP